MDRADGQYICQEIPYVHERIRGKQKNEFALSVVYCLPLHRKSCRTAGQLFLMDQGASVEMFRSYWSMFLGLSLYPAVKMAARKTSMTPIIKASFKNPLSFLPNFPILRPL